jgi:hypothetical protein
MRGFYLNAQEISVAVSACKHFPEGTPGRWKLVSKLIKELLKDEDNSVCFPIGRQCQTFDFSSEHCRELHRLFVKDFKLLYTIEERKHDIMHGENAGVKDAYKPLILLPSLETCISCQRKLRVRDVPSYPVVYTCSGGRGSVHHVTLHFIPVITLTDKEGRHIFIVSVKASIFTLRRKQCLRTNY